MKFNSVYSNYELNFKIAYQFVFCPNVTPSWLVISCAVAAATFGSTRVCYFIHIVRFYQFTRECLLGEFLTFQVHLTQVLRANSWKQQPNCWFRSETDINTLLQNQFQFSKGSEHRYKNSQLIATDLYVPLQQLKIQTKLRRVTVISLIKAERKR